MTIEASVHVASPYKFGALPNPAATMRDPSRFLRDIPSELLRLASARASSFRYDDQSAWSPAKPTPPARAYRLPNDDGIEAAGLDPGR